MGEREQFHQIRPGTHYLTNQPELIDQVAALTADWALSITSNALA
jgi:hypothetical protein